MAAKDAAHAQVVVGNGLEDPRPAKRSRTSASHLSSTWAPSAQAETSLEVDIMILDHLAAAATAACLESRTPQPDRSTHELRRALQLANSFIPIFKVRHPHHQPDANLRLRLLVLKLATLFTQRFTLNPSTPDRLALQALRNKNRQRAIEWNAKRPELRASAALEQTNPSNTRALPLDLLERNRARVLDQLSMPPEDEDYEDVFYGTAQCVSLLDVLPLFMEVSAASINLTGSTVTPKWMHLACEFILHACLEQRLVCGGTWDGVVDEAFAWGYIDGEVDQQQAATATHLTEINDMFEDEDATEVEGWQALKAEYARELRTAECDQPASEDTKLGANLESATAKHSVVSFESAILKFLNALSISIATPVLAQLQRGQLDGTSEDETREFLLQYGVDTTSNPG